MKISIILGIVVTLAMVSPASAWWDNGWADRREIAINNTAGISLSHHQVHVNLTDAPINTTSLRVVNETASAVVPCWIEAESGGNAISVWFNATGIAASSWCNSTYYIYYTNASASSVSNITTTFLFGDIFDTLDWTNKWQSADQTKYSVSGGKLLATVPGAAGDWMLTQNTYNNVIIETSMRESHTGGVAYLVMDSDATWSGSDLMMLNWNTEQTQVKIGGVVDSESESESLTDYYRYTYKIPSSGDATGEVLKDSVSLHTYENTPAFTTVHTGFLSWAAGTAYYDWIFVREYASTDPHTIVGGEESSDTSYIPPNPTNLANAGGNYWVNHTWTAGSGNVTDLYHVHVNDVWHNTSANTYYNESYNPGRWQNITVYAVNTSGTDTDSVGSVSGDVQVSSADWWNNAWINRREINIDNTGGPALSHYQVYVNLTNTPINMSSLRTVNATSGSVIPHWNISTSGGDVTEIWVNMTGIAASSWCNSTYIYYNNSAATITSNGNDTFQFFDDFDYPNGTTVLNSNLWSWTPTDVNLSFPSPSVLRMDGLDPPRHGSIYSKNSYPSGAIGWKIATGSEQTVNNGAIDKDVELANRDIYYWHTEHDSYSWARIRTNDVITCNSTQHPVDRLGIVEVQFNSSYGKILKDGVVKTGCSAATTSLYAWAATPSDTFGPIHLDWCYIRKYTTDPDPTSSLGTEEAAPPDGYTPPNPTSLTNTTGNYWVNHTWQAGAGNITNSYNVSVNDVWHNTSPAYYNVTCTPNAWQNITVYAFNSTGAGTISADNITQNTRAPSAPITISLHSVFPENIHTNHTGAIQVNYTVESTNPLNLSSLAMLYGINYTTTGDMHSYIASPPNTIASEGIYRAPNRNTTPHLSWENNATITGGNVWQWGGVDNDSTRITATQINATHTWINATGYPEHIFQGSFYLGRRAMDTAPKTAFEVNSQQGLIIKMWDNEAIRGRSIDYLMNMYFDSDWESTIPTSPIEIWGLNSSFNPDTDDPTTSEFGAKIVEWDGNRWINHSWIPDANASYAYPLVFDAATFPVIPDETNYIYLKSDTQSSKSYVLNATNHDPGICNLTFAQTDTLWTYNELADVSTHVAYTPSFFTTFVRDDEQFLHHLYIADDAGEWAHSDINNISIGVSHYPVAAASFDYFNITCPTIGHILDTGMGSTYDNGYMHIGIYCHADPDGGTVSHNITLHYVNETLVGIINNTFQTTSPGLYEINFTTTPYYSTTEAYILKCVSTDDEGSVATTWLDSFFTLAADGTQGYYVNEYLMFWGMNNIPTLYSTVANNSLISYDAGSDIYTMHVPFFKSKCNDTFWFNETVHLKSLNTEDVAYFRFGGETIFDSANIHGWNTVTDTPAPSTDAYRGYMFSCCRITTGNITNSNLSYLGSDVYRQEGVNFIGNTMDYLIYNTTLSHNSRGIIMEECENFNISHCTVSDSTESGIGMYYSDSITVENCTISDSAYDPGLYLYEAGDTIIRYNTITDCVDYGMRIRSNSNNNTLIGNNITGSGIYDYYFSSAAINNTIRNPASTTDKIRVTSTSEVNIENTDNAAFSEDSSNSTYAYPANFSMSVTGVSHTFDISQRDMTITPNTGSVKIWNLALNYIVTFNASNVSGSPSIWVNITQPSWANSNVSIYRDDVIYANETADVSGHIAYNYSGGWSEHWFKFIPENAAPDKPTLVIPANGATGTSTNPTLRVMVTDDNSVDTLNVTFYAQGGTQIGSTQTGIANGSTASVVWAGRSYSNTYYWYAVSDDGTAQTQSDTWNFRTQGSGSGSSHVIDITGCTDWEGNAGNQVYIDFGYTGETAGATFTTNATNGSIDSSTGIYTWNTATADAGVYTWRFNVENVYSVSDYCDVTITVYHYASPTNLAATTGNFWVNHTWDGNGFTDSYNISVNNVWTNGSTDQYSYHVRYPHAWSNISVAAFNDTTGLSSFISNDVQVPNNPIILTNYTVLMLATAGDNVTVDMNHEDLDGDTATYYCSRMDLFADFNTADGTGQYTNAINGTHEVIFGVTDGYGWDNETITIEVGAVHPLELDEETPLILFVVLVVLLFGSLFYIYHAVSYVAKIVTALISTWMSFMLSNMAVSGNVVLNYAELSAGDVFIYGAHSIQIAALSHFFMFTGVVSALFMLAFVIKLVIDTYLDMQEKRKADEEWDGVEQ